MASLGYSANCNLAIFVLVALHANAVNIPRSRSPIASETRELFSCHEFFLKLVVLDKIPTSPFLEFARFLFLEYHKYCHIFKTKKTFSQNQERVT